MHVDFCLPIKNEAAILAKSLEKLLAYCRQSNWPFTWQIIGVVNGSNDNSQDILLEFKRRFPKEVDVFVILQPGRGRALKKYWSQSQADILIYMDTDLAVSLEDISKLVNPLLNNQADLTVGSRLIPGAKTKRSLVREVISRSYSFIFRFMLHSSIRDSQCGFKAIKAEVFQRLKPYCRDDYWFFDTELIVLGSHFNYRVREVPVDWKENRSGTRQSTVKIWRDSWLFLKNLQSFRKYLKTLPPSC